MGLMYVELACDEGLGFAFANHSYSSVLEQLKLECDNASSVQQIRNVQLQPNNLTSFPTTYTANFGCYNSVGLFLGTHTKQVGYTGVGVGLT